jgi:site-specific recombinase XerD
VDVDLDGKHIYITGKEALGHIYIVTTEIYTHLVNEALEDGTALSHPHCRGRGH